MAGALKRDPAVAVLVLGPRPGRGQEREVWDQAARAVSAYRLAYDITDQTAVLGPEPDRRGFEQHQAFERAAQQVLEARRQLGVHRGQRLGPVSEQVRGVPGLTPPGQGLDRGPSLGR